MKLITGKYGNDGHSRLLLVHWHESCCRAQQNRFFFRHFEPLKWMNCCRIGWWIGNFHFLLVFCFPLVIIDFTHEYEHRNNCQEFSIVNNLLEKVSRVRGKTENSPKPTSVAMNTPPKLSSVIPSESSFFKQDPLSDAFQYFAVKSSKKRSFCNSRITRESSS